MRARRPHYEHAAHRQALRAAVVAWLGLAAAVILVALALLV